MKSALDVGKIIKERRTEQNFTQLELAKKLFVSEKTVSRWECGEGYPSMYIIDDLCSVLGISLNDLLGNKNDLISEDELFSSIKKKRNKLMIFGKFIVTFLSFVMLMLSFVQMDKIDSYNGYSLFNVMLGSSSISLFAVISSIFFIILLVKIVLSITDIVLSVKTKKHNNLFLISILLSVLIAISALLLELLPSSNLHVFAFVSFFILVISLALECGLLFIYHSVNNLSEEKLQKRYWIIACVLSYVLAIGLYLSLLYLSLVIMVNNYQIVLYTVNFFFGVLSPILFAYSVLQIFKVKKVSIVVAISLLSAILILTIIFSILEIRLFQYAMDILVYIGIIVSPSFAFYVLNKINTYKKEQKKFYLI